MYQLVLLCCLCVLWLYYKKQSSEDPPTLSGWLPLIGHAHKLLGDNVKLFNVFEKIAAECTEKGGVITMYLGPKKLYALTDPDDCLTVMNTCLDKSLYFKFGKQFLGNGLITADAQRWMITRKLLNPAFSQKVLDTFMGIFNTQSEDLVDKFLLEKKQPFDHETLLRMNNLETICATSFDVHDEECREILKKYLPLLNEGSINVNTRMQKFWLHPDVIYNMSSLKRDFDKLIHEIVVLSKMMIERNKSEKKKFPNQKLGPGTPRRFIDLLLDVAEETNCFSEQDIREESDTFIVGGHETTANAMVFALTLLGAHTDVQEKVYQEIINVCGNTGPVEKQDLSKLIYTEAVFKETLRLIPVATLLPRRINQDLKLKNYSLKAGTDCLILVYGLHRHTIWGADADKFRPERWLNKGSVPDAKYFGGFGLGKRSCIGKVYAMMSMKITLVHVIRKFRIYSDVSKLVFAIQLFTKAQSGHFIRLEQR